MSPAEIEERVRSVICEELGLEHVTFNAHLQDDLGADEISRMEVQLGLEEEFEIEVPEETDVDGFRVRDWVKLVQELKGATVT